MIKSAPPPRRPSRSLHQGEAPLPGLSVLRGELLPILVLQPHVAVAFLLLRLAVSPVKQVKRIGYYITINIIVKLFFFPELAVLQTRRHHDQEGVRHFQVHRRPQRSSAQAGHHLQRPTVGRKAAIEVRKQKCERQGKDSDSDHFSL